MSQNLTFNPSLIYSLYRIPPAFEVCNVSYYTYPCARLRRTDCFNETRAPRTPPRKKFTKTQHMGAIILELSNYVHVYIWHISLPFPVPEVHFPSLLLSPRSWITLSAQWALTDLSLSLLCSGIPKRPRIKMALMAR